MPKAEIQFDGSANRKIRWYTVVNQLLPFPHSRRTLTILKLVYPRFLFSLVKTSSSLVRLDLNIQHSVGEILEPIDCIRFLWKGR